MFLVLNSNGLFYETYNEDAMIIHFLFGYKINKKKASFPISSKNKVINILENKKINYKINDNNNETEKKDFKNLNCYQKTLDKAYKISFREKKLNNILRKLKKLDSEKLEELVNIIGKYVDEKQ